MNTKSRYLIKIADSKEEFNLIHKLNYKTFVEEIPQHSKNDTGLLVDKFHDENTYIIALDGDILIGMIAVRGIRPFSLDFKIPNLDDYLPKDVNICEIRLLSIEQEYRKTLLFFEMAKKLVEYCNGKDYNFAIISGTTRQQKLYKHIGFKPFYKLVGKEGAFYQPMYIDIKLLEMGIGKLLSNKN